MTQVSPPPSPPSPPSPTKLSSRRVDEAIGAAHRHMASKEFRMFKIFGKTRCDVYRALGYLPYLANPYRNNIVISNVQCSFVDIYKDQHLASEMETHPSADPETACLGSDTFAFGGMSLDPPKIGRT